MGYLFVWEELVVVVRSVVETSCFWFLDAAGSVEEAAVRVSFVVDCFFFLFTFE